MSFTDIGTDAFKIMSSRSYLRVNENRELVETPIDACRRLAITAASVEKNKALRKLWEEKYFEMLVNRLSTPNTPAWSGARDQFSACFVLPVEDSIDSIFKSIHAGALVHQTGGGTGYGFSKVRESGALVKSTNGIASGPISFIHAYDAATETIKQGSARRGANMGCLIVNHPDIEAFITAKAKNKYHPDPSNPTKLISPLQNFNLSVLLTDDFMNALLNDEDFELVSPTGKVVKTVNAQKLFDKIAYQAWDTGEPGCLFKDTINKHNTLPGLGDIESTNPCWTGDTRIWTIQGPKSFEELVQNGISSIPVLTNVDGKLAFRTMHNIRMTCSEADTVTVTLTDGTFFTCTPTHNLYLKDGTKVKAADLKSGCRLSSAYRYKANSKGYIRLSNGKDSVLEHRLVAGSTSNVELTNAHHVHHLDGIKDNNTPDNLQIMLAKEHNALNMRGSKNPMSGVWDERNPLFNIDTSGKNNGRYKDSISDERLALLKNQGLSYAAIAKIVGCSKYTVMNRLGWKRPTRKVETANHTVASITRNPEKVPVYNGTVEETHTYYVFTQDNEAILSANCGEQPLYPYEACVLGSIVLSRHLLYNKNNSKWSVDYEKLKNTVSVMVRYLDSLIDAGKYPLPEIDKQVKNTRKIGLGVMGFHDLLIQLRIPYDSEEGLEVAESVMKFIRDTAFEASCELAKEKGTFPAVDYSIWDKESAPRNATCTTIAPTGTTSLVMECSSGIEPLFALTYMKELVDGEGYITYVNQDVVAAINALELTDKQKAEIIDSIKNEGSMQNCPYLSDDMKALYKTALEISPEWHIRMQAAFQKYTDNAVSKTINLPESATVQDVKNAYLLAWKSGLKGTTVYRYNSRDQVLTTGSSKPAVETESSADDVKVKKRDDILEGRTHRAHIGCGKLYVTVNRDSDGELAEVFASLGKAGNCAGAQLQAIGKLISCSMRGGVPAEHIIKMLRGIRCSNISFGDKGPVTSCADAIAQVLEKEFAFDKSILEISDSSNGGYGICPECSSNLEAQSGCAVCRTCGFSKCG